VESGDGPLSERVPREYDRLEDFQYEGCAKISKKRLKNAAKDPLQGRIMIPG